MTPAAVVRAKAVVRADPFRSQLERDYAMLLTARERSGDVVWFGFECWRFKVGVDAWFTPDFVVQMPDGTLEMHETKGWLREAARVRLAAAVLKYPMFRWLLVKRELGGLTSTEWTPT